MPRSFTLAASNLDRSSGVIIMFLTALQEVSIVRLKTFVLGL